ncbi:MAG: Holliday junction branch migration protein RuvA, partial [Miltoncostaeaceae bacterium]
AAPGVGKRTAERVVLELSDRLGAGNGAAAAPASAPKGPFDDARAGLEGLGFTPEEAQEALAGAPTELDSEALVRHALDRLHRR